MHITHAKHESEPSHCRAMKPQERRGRAVVGMESEDNENEEKNNNIEMSEIEKQGKTET